MSNSDAAALAAGFWDFSFYILTPTVRRHMPAPHTRTALEIGRGDGALLNAASLYFANVIGVEVDEDEAEVRRLLDVQDRGNNLLMKTKGAKLPVGDDSVDFVYSLTALPRLRDFSHFESYIMESARVLKPGGVAMLWFGRFAKLPLMTRAFHWLRGYQLLPDAPANDVNLAARVWTVRRIASRAGMRIVALSTPAHPDTSWRLFRGGRLSYITVVKQR